MPGLTSQQKTMISQFVSFTQADKKAAERVLKNYNWNLQQAVDGYFNNPSSRSAPSDSSAAPLNKLFDKYRDAPTANPDTIGMEGTMEYMKDLQINIESIGLLVLAELVGSPTLGEITRTGFIAGWSAHSATTITAQRALLTSLIASLPRPESRAAGGAFRKVYKHTFKIACPVGSKSIPLENACEFWKSLFGPQGAQWTGSSGKSAWLDWWLDFLADNWKKAVNRDLWDQTLIFEEKTREDETMAWWSEDSAWPGIIDEFVVHVKRDKGVGGDAMEVE